MRLSVRSSLPAVLAVAIALTAACKDDPSGPNILPADRIFGAAYDCTRARVWYSNPATAPQPEGPGEYNVACPTYGNYTVPNRRDSIEVYGFEIDPDSTVRRLDFPIGTASYDSRTGILTITTPGYATASYGVVGVGGDVALSRKIVMDLDGDSVTDSVIFTYLQR